MKYLTYIRYEEDGQIKEKIKENKTLKRAYDELDNYNVKFYKIYDIKQMWVNHLPNKYKGTFKPKMRVQKRYSIEEVHALFDKWEALGSNRIRKQRYISGEFDGYPVKTWSQRYNLFRKNTKCVNCGLEANCYMLEKDATSKLWHFNLYHIAEDGTETLFTKDHIIPKSKNGKNRPSNYQTMCYKCNQEKADKYDKLKEVINA